MRSQVEQINGEHEPPISLISSMPVILHVSAFQTDHTNSHMILLSPTSNLMCAREPGRDHGRTRLTLEREAGADLVAGLVELLGVEGDADAEGEALIDLGVVREGEEAAVVDLGLDISISLAFPSPRTPYHRVGTSKPTLANDAGSILYLDAISTPTAELVLVSYVAFTPASVVALTLW